MVQTLALRAAQDGVIWARRPLVSSKGLLSRVQNLPLSSHDKRPARFRAVAFNASGELLAATDERGRVFVFFVTLNRYALVQHLGVPTVSCCFSPARRTELLVTCEDESVRCIDVQALTLVSTLRGHRFPARCASFQRSGRLALTASQDAVILWDTKDWSRYRVLNAGPGVEQAAFVGKGDLVAVCFQDDTIMMWELESLALRYRFSLPEREQSPGLQKIAVSEDQQVLVASGRAPFIYVWGFESQTIIRIIELPPPIKQVASHAFLPGHSTTISILGDDGSIFFLDVAAKNPQIKLEISDSGRTISAFDIECHARYLAASTSDGYLLLYLPAVVYPFVKIFRENDLAAFEASVSVMLHWCGDFLISLPYPPVFAMSAIEKELARRDAQLYDHFTRYQVTSEEFAWSLLKTIFTEVLSEDEWMCLWDHLFSYSDTPQLLFVAVLAYLSYFRTALLASCDRFSIEQFFHQQNAIDIQKFVQLMMNLREKLDLTEFTSIENPAADASTPGRGPYWPLSRGQYPAFAHYPRFVVDFQISERNRIALEEAELVHKQKLLDDVAEKSDPDAREAPRRAEAAVRGQPIEDSDSDSDDYSTSTMLDALQRPIAELEKKLGIRFDDFSDEEKEDEYSFDIRQDSDEEDDETIEDDRAKLLLRAKRLLELSSFDSDSDDEL
ncbi:tbc1 domain family member 31 isoform x4 [Phytophthora cinnamomi]|uniref:tbc1 domain family member 31 isoform x4 n=1 Tax=Phytophthora cinnamomi TaxID=4785 RepID=UPI00355AB35B|nr:tbc1 domain family member 31 isoform x4 [Phytophthora cinnamomi]